MRRYLAIAGVVGMMVARAARADDGADGAGEETNAVKEARAVEEAQSAASEVARLADELRAATSARASFAADDKAGQEKAAAAVGVLQGRLALAVARAKTSANKVARLALDADKAASEEAEKIEQAVPATSSGTAGLSTSEVPIWTLLGDAAVDSLDVSKPSVGLGLERGTPWTLLRFVFRKNVAENTLTAGYRDRTIGQAVLTPSLANLSAFVHAEGRPWAYISCGPGRCTDPDRVVHTKKSYGGYFRIEAADISLSTVRSDGSALDGHLIPIALAFGGVARLEGYADTNKLGSQNQFVISSYLGFSGRAIGYDTLNANRAEVFDTEKRFNLGGEIGVGLQLGNLILDGRITTLTNFEERIEGLTGVQFQIRVTFALPWTVLGGERPATSGGDDQNATGSPAAPAAPAPAAPAPAAPAAPAPAAPTGDGEVE
jgi:hypothetical protein